VNSQNTLTFQHEHDQPMRAEPPGAPAVLLLTGAALGERLGRRRMLAAGVALFTAASAACALAPNAWALIAARAVQGAGAALMLPLALALLSAAFPPQRRAWALGIFSSVTGIAVLAGPVVGGAVTQGLSWNWIFWLNVPIGLVMIPLILTRIPANTRTTVRLDPVGLILATGGALGIIYALIRADSAGWASPEIVLTIAAGGASRRRLRALGTTRRQPDGATAPISLTSLRGR
jgi:MFS family permease